MYSTVATDILLLKEKAWSGINNDIREVEGVFILMAPVAATMAVGSTKRQHPKDK